MTALAAAALRLAARGVAVFPLAPGTKIPTRGSHGCRAASCDLDVARARWQRSPRANIAAATGARSGFWVLDVDLQHDGPASLAKLEAQYGALPSTIESSTPSGGRHLYFRWRADLREIRSSTSRVGKGLDVRGEGGSIVMPPSVLADGRRYRWVRNGARAFADAPGWLLDLARPPAPAPRAEPVAPPKDLVQYAAAAVRGEFLRVERAAAGTRNEILNTAAFNIGQLIGAGCIPPDWAANELERRAVAAGLGILEARRTIESAFRAGLARPRELPR